MKHTIKLTCSICCLLLINLVVPASLLAQTKAREVNTQYQSWFSINSIIRLSDKFGIVADAHMRRNKFVADPGFYFLRIGADYWLKENITLTLGYGKMWVAPGNPNWHLYGQENRLYQQVQMSSKIGKLTMVQRIRNEQRWQQKIVNDTFTHKYKFTNRLRYLFSLNVPVFKNPHYPSIMLSDELAIQFGKEIVYNTFDQNRVFVGIKQPISKNLNFDLGYMLVYQQKASGYQYDRNHTFRLFFYYTPDVRKKK